MATNAQHVEVRAAHLPTRGELEAAVGKMQKAFDEVERVKWELGNVHEHAFEHCELPEGVVIDDAYIGLLYRRVSDFESQHEQMGHLVRQCRELLYELDGDGRNADCRRRTELETR